MCDACGGKLVQRDDDQEETIRKRLQVYQAQTAPLIDYYQQKNLLMVIDGMQDIGMVREEILSGLQGMR